eukprot:TRINITY_DN12993_c0_g1_i2.p1 TRINITY_DN12993_c0_g1~~TRINITY_DN12993_c0_g1_i2.p1  ORF type:complete len:499 (-),score=173.17 TRINITY_DN12993_c0_g1_i2:160-1656(-)
MRPMESLKAAEQLGDSYKAAYEEIAHLRRTLNRSEPGDTAAEPAAAVSDPNARVQQFKHMLADRRAAALAAFSAEDENERVSKLQEMLADCKAPPPPELVPPVHEAEADQVVSTVAEPPVNIASQADKAIERAMGGDRPPSVFDKLMESGKVTKARLNEQRLAEQSEVDAVRAKAPANTQVVERLTRAHKETKARLDEARRAKTTQERNLCREPKISRRAQELGKRGDVGDRLMEYGRQRNERIAQQEQQHREAVESEALGQPTINQKSQRLDRNVDMYFAWEARKKLRLQQQQEKQKRDEMAEVKSAPTISRNSARIVKQMNRASRIEEQLLTQGQLKSAKKKQEAELEEQMQRNKRTPKISVHSAALERPGNVCDRLYLLAQQKQHDRHLKAQQKDHPPNPKINSRSKSLGRAKSQGRRSSEKVEDRLLAQGNKYRQKAESRAQAVRTHEVCTTKPRVGPYSRLLVELMEKRTGSTAAQRLQQPCLLYTSPSPRDS